jgi:hypothetical protein
MRSSPKLASAALALSIVFLSFVSSAFVEPKEEVAARRSVGAHGRRQCAPQHGIISIR